MLNVKLSENQKEWAIKGGSGFLFSLIGWFLVVQPGIQKTNALKEKSEEARVKSQLISEIRPLRKQYKKLEEWLLPASSRHAFLGKMAALTKASGLEIVSLEPAEEPEEYYARLILTMNVRTRFPSLIRFLNQLEEMKPLVSVSRMRIGAMSQREPPSSAGGKVEVSLTFESTMKKGPS